jgi:hypothetical protein
VPMVARCHEQDAPFLLLGAFQYSALRAECTKERVRAEAPSAKCSTHWGLLLPYELFGWTSSLKLLTQKLTTKMR